MQICDVNSFMCEELRNKPLQSGNIRITIWENKLFIQWLDVPEEFTDAEISELCNEVFEKQMQWMHFSATHRYTRSVNFTPPYTLPVTPDMLRKVWR